METLHTPKMIEMERLLGNSYGEQVRETLRSINDEIMAAIPSGVKHEDVPLHATVIERSQGLVYRIDDGSEPYDLDDDEVAHPDNGGIQQIVQDYIAALL